jgi:hypothetical protein
VGSTDRLEIHGGVLAASIDFQLERKPVAFVESRHSGAFDGRNVDEGVRLAVIALDEAESLHCVEELDGALRLFAGQLALRSALGALDGYRLAFDSKVRRRNPSAAIDQGEFQRLPVGEIGQARLLDGRDVDEHVLPAVIADDEAESLLGIEELHHALPFADNLGRHASTAAAETAAIAAAAAAADPAAAVTAAAAESAAIAKAPASASKAAAILESAAFTVTVFSEEPVALVSSATAAVAPTPSIETHAGQISLCHNHL